MLLAVPPVLGQPWTVADLHRVLLETLDLAKLRAVDAEALGELGHYLPALYFAFNADDDAVSTDFAPLSVTASREAACRRSPAGPASSRAAATPTCASA